MSKINMLDIYVNWTYGLFCENYRVTLLSTFFLTVSGIIIPSLKVTGQF